MRILITGSNGFIGRNLVIGFSQAGINDLLYFNREDDVEILSKNIKLSDVIIHLAGEMRADENVIYDCNVNITDLICKLVSAEKANKKIIFASSIQVLQNSIYGKSKLIAEGKLSQLALSYGCSINIYRFGHVFGKWSKPFYNSAISTFCYSAARNIELQVNDPSTYIYPVYIDDVVRSIISLALEESNSSNVNYPEISPSYKITVGELSELIHNFQDQNYLTLPDLSDGLTKALYSTYISYLPEEKFTQNLIASIDERGSFIELMKGKSFGQMSFLTCKPGFIRGEHYHNSKTEKFFIVEGDALFTFRSLRDNKTLEIFASSSKPLIVQSIPGWVHNIKNIGNKDLLALVWANEIFQKKNPDTYPCKVTK